MGSYIFVLIFAVIIPIGFFTPTPLDEITKNINLNEKVEAIAPINVHWSSWRSWSTCSKTCGIATKSRRRICPKRIQQCPRPHEEVTHCILPSCDEIQKCWSIDKSRAGAEWCIDNCLHIPPYCPEDFCKCEAIAPISGQWSSWSSWSACGQTCGSATKSRTRTCSSWSNGGKRCPGPAKELMHCRLPSCDDIEKCWSIDKSRASDQWCIDNCLHIPPYCPEDFCKCEEYSCYANDTTPYRRFGARTSYLINANLDTEVSVPGCKPVMLWLNVHHGTRGPQTDEIVAMKETLPAIRQAIIEAFEDGKSKLCEKDVNNLKNWKIIYTAEEDRLLGDAGRKEMRELGQRMGKRFPGLLKDSQKTVRKTSPEQRVHDSMKALIMGLYDHAVDFEDSTDDMFTFNDKCPAWVNGVRLNNRTYIEMNKLIETPAYEQMVAEISNRIGVQLNIMQVKIAYVVCRYEIANYPDAVSPWCSLFSEGNLRLMEYVDDLRYYYLDGYGNDISWKMTQPLVADLHQHFSSLKAGQENIPAFLYVVRSRVAHAMLLALGLYKDEKPPLASDWPTPHTLWRTSTMLSFGHNLALVALQCDDPQDQFKVLAMHQERRISLNGICGQDICPLQSFLDNIKSIVDLDFDKVCQYKNQWSSWSPWSACSQTCGSATKSRTRTCSSGCNGSKQCPGEAEEIVPCILPSCVPIDSWTSWSPWSVCSQSCGSATKSRTRTCPSRSNGGKQCPGPAEEIIPCIIFPCESSCYANDTTPYRRVGARTSYLINANLDTEVSVPGCKPVMLWHNVHHGIRGPHKGEIEAMKERNMLGIRQAIVEAFEDGKSKLCEADVNNLKNWKIIYTAEEDRLLGEAGRKEMRELGQRMGKRFPGLLKDSQKTVKKTSPDQRTSDSMKAFLVGLYGHPVDFDETTDAMLTFNERCPAFRIGVDLNNRTFIEMNKLKETPEYEKMVAEISNRIGVQLNRMQVEIAYIVCRYEIGNYPDAVSPWCALFSESNMRLMEYVDDLRYYYLDGYGNDISWKMTQPLVADLHQHFSSLKAGQENMTAFLYVVHSRIAHAMLPALGLYKDEKPPLASDWPTPHTLWRTSTMLSFGHNLALVALQCDDPQDQFKVLAMHQERRISLSGICGQDICPLQSFLDNIKSIVDIDFDKLCRF